MKAPKISVVMTARLPVDIKKKAKVYVSCCPILDIFSQGYTEEEAKSNLVEAVSLFFISCFERGTLDEALKECGFELAVSSEMQSSMPLVPESYIDVPIQFQVTNNHQIECQG